METRTFHRISLYESQDPGVAIMLEVEGCEGWIEERGKVDHLGQRVSWNSKRHYVGEGRSLSSTSGAIGPQASLIKQPK